MSVSMGMYVYSFLPHLSPCMKTEAWRYFCGISSIRVNTAPNIYIYLYLYCLKIYRHLHNESKEKCWKKEGGAAALPIR